MKRFKKWLAIAGLLLCLTAGSVCVYADPETEKETTQESSAKQQDSTNDRQSKDKEQDKTTVPTETPVPTEQPIETETPVPTEVPETVETPVPAETQVPAETAEEKEADAPDETAEKEQPAEGTKPTLPKGNLTLAEDIVSKKNGNREFLTVYSREGDYFYIIIDRDAAGSGNVFFLNMVDDQDLYSLSGVAIPDRTVTEDTTITNPGSESGNEKICTCVTRCSDGKVDPGCAVCKDDPEKCKGLKTLNNPDNPDQQEEGQKKPELNLPVLVGGATALILLILFYFLKIRKKEKQSNVPVYNIEDYLTNEEEDGSDDGD